MNSSIVLLEDRLGVLNAFSRINFGFIVEMVSSSSDEASDFSSCSGDDVDLSESLDRTSISNVEPFSP